MPKVAHHRRLEATDPRERSDRRYRLLGGLWATKGLAIRGYKANDGQTVWIRDNTLTRVRECRRHQLPDQHAGIGWDAEQEHFFGVNTCASVWACPVCSAKIRHGRTEEVKQILNAHLAEGGKIGFVTLTLSHRRGMPLAELLDAVAGTWRQDVISGRAWNALSKEWGIEFAGNRKTRRRIGLIRTLEIKFSENGFHPHLHVYVLYHGDDEVTGHLRRHITHQWRKGMADRGYRVAQRIGVSWKDVTPENVDTYAAYGCKVQDGTDALALEITQSDLKQGKARSGRGMFDILADYVIDGDTYAGAVWMEYERATKGRQAITFGQGLRERFNVEVTEDEDLAQERVGGENSYTFDRTESVWVRSSMPRMLAVKQAAREAGYLGIVDLFLSEIGHASGGALPLVVHQADPWADPGGLLPGEQARLLV